MTDPCNHRAQESSRRRFLLAAAAGAATWISPAFAVQRTCLAAAWNEGNAQRIGVLALKGDCLVCTASLAVPTRAHGLMAGPGGTLFAVARRPGDWMLRWQPGQREADWIWAEPGRAFNGHVAWSADRKRLFTSETDLETGAGLIVVRDARTMATETEWPAHGIDPHALLWEGNTLIVANGGIPARPETGRVKRGLAQMDSSLVRLDGSSGELLGQWRLDDRRLSLRHLARNGCLTGIAVQAEHDDPADRGAAPVLAIFDGQQLSIPAPGSAQSMKGYGGDIAACGSGFAIGAPRAGRIGRWTPEKGWQAPDLLPQGCAIAAHGGRAWAAGHSAALHLHARHSLPVRMPESIRIDNHWIVL